MDVVNAFKSTENYLEFFKEACKACLEHQICYEKILAKVENKFQELINDGKPAELDDFLVPEPPKTKRQQKEKRISRAKKLPPLNSEILRNNQAGDMSATAQNDIVLRRSSHFFPKTKTYQDPSNDSPTRFALPPSLSVESITCAGAGTVQRSLNESVSTTDMNQPLGSSTPTNSVSEVISAKENYSNGLASSAPAVNPLHKVKRPNTRKMLKEKTADNIKTKDKHPQKKEVVFKASTDETKRRREEHARKVAAQREAAEKENLELAMKLVKEKEMKLKLIQKQKDEKLRMEALRKKQIAAAKAAENEERRKREEAARLLKMKGTEPQTEFCDYGIEHVLDGTSSDDDGECKNRIPLWATKEHRKVALRIQALLRKKVIFRWFHNEKLKYPELKELFSADTKMRPRTSSAYWNSKICLDESFR